MEFRTEIHVEPAQPQLSLQTQVITVGSCFSDVIGNKLREHKVPVLVNPFGTIFNPVAAVNLLLAACGEPVSFEAGLVERESVWYSLDLHSSFAAPTRQELLLKIDEAVLQVQHALQKTELLILTFGTALVYRHLESGQLVANCHKLPARNFEKKLLTTEQITQAVRRLQEKLQQVNPAMRLLLTVSPVRHLKETLLLNSVSKATLRLACHQLTQELAQTFYFPAYELLLDDLRDYRFYEADMLHPSAVAEAYIWQKFSNAWFDAQFHRFSAEWDKVRRALAHKPFQPETSTYQAFLQNLLHKLNGLHAVVDCTPEIEQVQELLARFHK